MLPHALFAPPALQVVPVQQPIEQDVPSQVHIPVVVSQACPVMHAGPLFCHWPHASHCCGCAPLHCALPGVHVGALGQEHAPQVQVCEHVRVPYVLQDCVAGGSQGPCPVQEPAIHMPPAPHVSVSVPQFMQASLRV